MQVALRHDIDYFAKRSGLGKLPDNIFLPGGPMELKLILPLVEKDVKAEAMRISWSQNCFACFVKRVKMHELLEVEERNEF